MTVTALKAGFKKREIEITLFLADQDSTQMSVCEVDVQTRAFFSGMITVQMLKIKSGEFDIESIHTLVLNEEGMVCSR